MPTVLFFILNGYSPGAVEYANEARIALFTFGSGLVPIAVNDFAQHLALLATSGPRGYSYSIAVERGGDHSPHGSAWHRWSTTGKVAVVLITPAVVTVAGPVLFAIGREATRRSADGANISDGSAQRRAIVTTAGVAGTIMLFSVAVQNLIWVTMVYAPKTFDRRRPRATCGRVTPASQPPLPIRGRTPGRSLS